MKILKLQKLNNGQKAEIENLVQECLLEEGLERSLYLEDDINFNEDINSFYLLYEGIELVSVLTIFMPLEWEVEISGYTKPSERKKGYFKSLLQVVLDELKACGIKHLLFVLEPRSGSGLGTLKALGGQYIKSEYLLTKNIAGERDNQKVRIQEKESSNFEIKILKNEQIKEGVLLGAKIFPEDYVDVKEYYEDDSLTCMGAYLKGKLIGICNLTCNGNYASIFGFGIDHNYRGLGYGRTFLKEIIDYVKEKKINILSLAVGSGNKTAFTLYKSMEFQIQTQYDYYEYHLWNERQGYVIQ